MRCPKCGFNSFDYLSECRKCGADLTKTRQELGFKSGKPAMPFLLERLLKEHKDAEPDANKATELDAFADLQHPSLALEDDLSISPGTAKDTAEDAGGIDFFDGAQPPPVKAAKASSQPLEDDEINFDLSGEQADWSFLDEQLDENLLSQLGQAEEISKPPALSDSAKKSRRQADEEAVIELSEEDLEVLFLELKESEKNDGDK